MSKISRYSLDGKVYVGGLGSNASKQQLEDAFSYYGPLHNVWVARNPPGFAFVDFEDPRNAEDAVRGLDGRILHGRRIRVELTNGKKLRDRNFSRRGIGRPFHPEDKCYECGEKGHYARDCHRYRNSHRRRWSRTRSKSKSRSRSRSSSSLSLKSRSRSSSSSSSRSKSKSKSKSRSRSGSRSKSRNNHSRSRSSRRSPSRSRSVKNKSQEKEVCLQKFRTKSKSRSGSRSRSR